MCRARKFLETVDDRLLERVLDGDSYALFHLSNEYQEYKYVKRGDAGVVADRCSRSCPVCNKLATGLGG